MHLDGVPVRQVLPAAVAPGTRGHWQCCSCDSTYPVETGWKVYYEPLPGVLAVGYVCPDCARAAMPD